MRGTIRCQKSYRVRRENYFPSLKTLSYSQRPLFAWEKNIFPIAFSAYLNSTFLHLRNRMLPHGNHCSAPASWSWLTLWIPPRRLLWTVYTRKIRFHKGKRTRTFVRVEDFCRNFSPLVFAHKRRDNKQYKLNNHSELQRIKHNATILRHFHQQSMFNWSHFCRVKITMKTFFSYPKTFPRRMRQISLEALEGNFFPRWKDF
mgnify:CR=1 FL=1